MNSIMHTAIEEVTEYETGEKNKGILFHHHVHDAENGGGNNDTGHRWHKKTFLVAGEVVMVSMHHIYKLLRPFTVCNGMKGKAVHQVFEECPKENTRRKSEKNAGIGKFKPEMAEIYEIDDNRQVNSPDYKRVGLGEHFHIGITEELSLPLIMNLFKLHFHMIWPRKYIKTL